MLESKEGIGHFTTGNLLTLGILILLPWRGKFNFVTFKKVLVKGS